MSSHPNTFLLINFSKDFQVTSVIDYERLNQGQFIQNNLKKDTLKHQSIEFIKSKFTDSSNIDQYLSSLIQFVEYPHEYWQDEQDLGLYYEQEDEFEDQQEVMTCPALLKAQNTPSIENEPENVMSFVTNSDHAISEIISQTNALLHEDFYLPPSNVHINRRVPLMEQLGTDFNEDSSSSVFDYIKENMNMAPVEQMFAERRQEQADKQKRIDISIQKITIEEINVEVKRIWSQNGTLDKRTRISKNDRELARNNLIKLIKIQEENNMHLEYLARHQKESTLIHN